MTNLIHAGLFYGCSGKRLWLFYRKLHSNVKGNITEVAEGLVN